MGGNVDSCCPIHQFPLIMCPLGSGNRCSVVLQKGCCDKAAAYECPFCGCKTYVCKSCVGITLPPLINHSWDFSQVDKHAVSLDSLEVCNTVDVDFDDTQNDEGLMLETTSNWDQDITPARMKELLDHVWDEISHESSAEGCYEMHHEMILPESVNEYENFDISDDDEASISDSGSDSEPDVHMLAQVMEDIPTTNAAMTAPSIEPKARKDRFGMHVLMNEHGSLLVHKSGHLKPCQAAKGFLEQIVATAEGQSIPLLYPEAMMFPSIFWNQHNDGALPVGLWSGNQAANAFGYAGLAEHMQCCLKNSSLLCSTDPKNVDFAFNAVNNLMSHRMDNQLVLKRGFEHMLGPRNCLVRPMIVWCHQICRIQ